MDIIKKLVDIDEQAKKLHRDNDRQREELCREIEEEKQKIYDRCISGAKKQVEAKSAEIKAEAKQSFEQKEARRKEKLNSLEELYAQNRDKWVDEIVERVLA